MIKIFILINLLILPVFVLAQDGSIPIETPSPTISVEQKPTDTPMDTGLPAQPGTTTVPAQGTAVPRPTSATSTLPSTSVSLTPTPTPQASPELFGVEQSNSMFYLIITSIASFLVLGVFAVYKMKIKKDDKDGNKCDGIKDLLEQKKKELQEMIKNYPEEKLKSMVTEMALGELKKNEDAKKIIETAENLKAKHDKLKETIEMLQKKYDLCMLELPSLGSSFRGTIVENSLRDRDVLKNINIEKTRKDEDWTIHDVIVGEEKIDRLAEYIDEGPWYMNFWRDGEDDMIIVFRDKKFKIKYSDKNTWLEAIEYGKSKGIPEEQLDFSKK